MEAPEDIFFSQGWVDAHVASLTGSRLAVCNWGFFKDGLHCFSRNSSICAIFFTGVSTEWPVGEEHPFVVPDKHISVEITVFFSACSVGSHILPLYWLRLLLFFFPFFLFPFCVYMEARGQRFISGIFSFRICHYVLSHLIS